MNLSSKEQERKKENVTTSKEINGSKEKDYMSKRVDHWCIVGISPVKWNNQKESTNGKHDGGGEDLDERAFVVKNVTKYFIWIQFLLNNKY